ncbi:MAG: FMN-binding negative transcriptional regulator [Kiloniellaceae bacterium]
MYVPGAFRLDDPRRIAEVMRAFDFALLVTAPGGRAQASHLPFLYDPDAGPHGTLHAHMARANPQWRDFVALAEAGQEALVIFQGPHSYISPTWYGEGTPNVPTWNYVAVHAYGLPQVIEDAGETRALLDRLVAIQESGLEPAWSTAGLTDKYMEGMLRGLVAFEIPVARLEAKAKLSQNKARAQFAAATAVVETAKDPLARATGQWMRRALEEQP